MKPQRTGLARLVAASGYSLRGLRLAWCNEAAFRQELVAAAVLTPMAVWLSESGTQTALMLLTLLLVLTMELLNAAIEAVVDRIGREAHPLAGMAKDISSAAVFISLVTVPLVWTPIIWDNLVS